MSLQGTATTLAGGSGAVILNSANAALLSLRPFTVVRVRGILHLSSDQAGAPEQQAVAMGLCVVSDQALAIGVSAVPTPVTDAFSDLFFVYQEIMTKGDATAAGQIGEMVQYDSRAMRKVSDDQDVIVVLESQLAALTDGTITRHHGRMLIKLH